MLILKPIIIPLQEKQKKPFLYTPSYIYHGAVAPMTSEQPLLPIHRSLANEAVNKPIVFKKKQYLAQLHNIPIARNSEKHKSMLAASYEFLQENQRKMVTSTRYNDPIYLIGDTAKYPNLLVKLLAYALSANFHYPEIAGRFGIKGKVIIGMTLYPDGHLSDIEILSSSGDLNLDNAALYAVNRASKIKKAHQFISQPKHFIIGFVFKIYSE
jgi:TonB family protein